MVTKRIGKLKSCAICSVLAKIHMVTKQIEGMCKIWNGSVLAKIHMVTKHNNKAYV